MFVPILLDANSPTAQSSPQWALVSVNNCEMRRYFHEHTLDIAYTSKVRTRAHFLIPY